MADDQEVIIKVRLDNTQAKATAKQEGDQAKQIEKTYNDVYEMIGRAAARTAARRAQAANQATKTEKDTATDVAKTVVDVYDVLGKASKKYYDDKTKQAKDSARAEVEAAEQVEAKGSDLSGMFSRIATSALSIRAVTGVYQSITGAMASAVDVGHKQVDQLLQLKNMIRDIASMTGSQGGSTDAFVQKFLDIRKASGLDNAGAQGFIQGFAGSGEAKKGINISAEEYEKAKPLLARFAAANSSGDAGAAESYGNLSGLLLGYRKNQTAGGALQDLTNFNEILKQGVGDNPALIREAAQQAGAVLNSEGTGIVRDPNQLAALISTASIQRSPGQSGTVVQQANRVLRGFTTKHAGLLQESGITANDDMVTGLYKLFDKIKDSESKGVQGDQFLAQGGVEGIEDRQAIMALYSGKDYLGRFLNQANNPMSAQAAQAQLDASFRGDAGLQTNVAQAELDESKMHAAMMQQHLPTLKLQAQKRLQDRGEGLDSADAANQDWWRGNYESVGGLTLPGNMTRQDLGRRIREEQEMHKILQEKGIEMPNRPDDTSIFGGYSSGYMSWLMSDAYEQDYAAATNDLDLQQKVMPGGKPMGAGRIGNDENWNRLIESNKRVENAIDRQTSKLSPPAVPVVQPGGRNNGATR